MWKPKRSVAEKRKDGNGVKIIKCIYCQFRLDCVACIVMALDVIIIFRTLLYAFFGILSSICYGNNVFTLKDALYDTP